MVSGGIMETDQGGIVLMVSERYSGDGLREV